ncbi:efflux RND transporter periplasmic adaptor subunit [Candidatus Gottesmanbacteria bacterium]|nr:efflux RND transporter periplasmic adaptor subunit [Candidatus Gottesmanbacteria bacterium]
MFNLFRKLSRTRKILLLAIVVVVVIIIYGNLNGKKKTATLTSVVKRGNLAQILTIPGTIDAEEKAALKFQTSGRLSWVGVKEGDYVKKYQSIASLDQSDLKKTLQKKLNDYLTNRWTFDQTIKDDYKDKALTDTITRLKDKAQFSLNNAVLDVELQDITVRYANLWTPIEGIVTKADPRYAGVNITSTTAEYDVVNPNSIYFSANADQTEVTKLKEGVSGELVLDPFPEDKITGMVKNISFMPKLGESGTVYEVKFFFDKNNSDYRFKLGMTGDLSFVTAKKDDVLYLPIRFVLEKDSKKYVTILKNGKKSQANVQTGLETDDNIEILSGVNEGDIVTE